MDRPEIERLLEIHRTLPGQDHDDVLAFATAHYDHDPAHSERT